MQRRGGLAATVGALPCVLQFCVATREFAAASGDSWPGRGQGVAAVYAGDGRGPDRSCLVAARGADVPRATVAPAADGLRTGTARRSWKGAAELRSDVGQLEGMKGRKHILSADNWLTDTN